MDGSQPAWRVFDSPGNPTGAQSSATAPGAASTPASRPEQRLAWVGTAAAIAIGALAIVLVVAGSGVETIEGPETGFGSFASASAGAIPGEILVDVTGAVVEPGLYRLGAGARVGAAIEAAGGYSPRADVDRIGAELNLAAVLADGDQVRVPSRDDAAPSHPPTGGGGGGGLVNLNDASQAELEALPGIGPVTAGKIVEARAEARFRTVDELRERGLVGEKTFEQIRPLVTAG